MGKSSFLFVVLLLFHSLPTAPVWAEEVDQFSSLYTEFPDSGPVINAKINALIEEALLKANAMGLGCQTEHLYESLHHFFSNKRSLHGGVFNKWLVHSPEVYRRTMDIRDTIYADFGFFDAPYFAVGVHGDAIETRIGNHRLGTDKADHFFSRGYRYFNQFDKKVPTRAALNERLQKSYGLEAGLWGKRGSGVFSYGDLAANFHGMTFWFHVLGEDPDLLGRSPGPYVRCLNQQWVKGKAFDWNDYLDDSWDETINCSLIGKEKTLRAVQQRLDELSEKKGHPIRCPMDKSRYQALRQKYNRMGLAQYLINPHGKLETVADVIPKKKNDRPAALSKPMGFGK